MWKPSKRQSRSSAAGSKVAAANLSGVRSMPAISDLWVGGEKHVTGPRDDRAQLVLPLRTIGREVHILRAADTGAATGNRPTLHSSSCATSRSGLRRHAGREPSTCLGRSRRGEL